MTMNKASERYKIPLEILKEYESRGLCGVVKKVMGAWQYDDQDIECLGMIMTQWRSYAAGNCVAGSA